MMIKEIRLDNENRTNRLSSLPKLKTFGLKKNDVLTGRKRMMDVLVMESNSTYSCINASSKVRIYEQGTSFSHDIMIGLADKFRINIQNKRLSSSISYKSIPVIDLEFDINDDSRMVEWAYETKLNLELLQLQASGKIDSALDLIFEKIETVLIQGEPHLCDAFLQDIEVNKYESIILTGILTATLNWKKHLTQRESFYYSVSSVIKRRHTSSEAEQILAGLL